MPTTRTRHMITESDELAECLDKAVLLWPELKGERADLLRKLIAEGMATISAKLENQTETRLAAIKRLNENFSGLWPADWNEVRKSEWPD